MSSAIPVVVIRDVLDVQVDGRVRAREKRGTRGVEDVAEDCARPRRGGCAEAAGANGARCDALSR